MNDRDFSSTAKLYERSRNEEKFMRATVLATFLVALTLSPSPAADSLRDCSDRNALQSVAIASRLVTIKFYYRGLLEGLADKNMQTCYRVNVLMDDKLVIINKVRDLVERYCLSIDLAAHLAAQDVCP